MLEQYSSDSASLVNFFDGEPAPSLKEMWLLRKKSRGIVHRLFSLENPGKWLTVHEIFAIIQTLYLWTNNYNRTLPSLKQLLLGAASLRY
jgi:hypothetical protein